MLNFEITDDPHYQGLELQVFDDRDHGRGMAVLLRRRDDGRLDIYRQPDLTLEPEMAQVGGDLGEWQETPGRSRLVPDQSGRDRPRRPLHRRGRPAGPGAHQ